VWIVGTDERAYAAGDAEREFTLMSVGKPSCSR
jgi:glutaminase